jgi:hypothetical protein
MNNLPLLMLQTHLMAILLEQDKHPAAGHYVHLTYWLAHRIGVTMDQKPLSPFLNIIRKKEMLVKTLQLIIDTSNDEDSRSLARQALEDIGVIAPPAHQAPLPHMPPMPEEPIEYGKDGDCEHYTDH